MDGMIADHGFCSWILLLAKRLGPNAPGSVSSVVKGSAGLRAERQTSCKDES